MEPPATASHRSSRRLLFDRRYGWVVDEWKDPSEEALAGGRGMFCVVPLTKTLFQTASQSVSFLLPNSIINPIKFLFFQSAFALFLQINSAVKFLDMKLQKLANPMHNPSGDSGSESNVLD
ncbi:uncharacterized protein LOC9314605 isoform X1 [Arabidopsis lyrata subsp. lyrata]|uniref:uncharacterized protein LOC9314605 isoform X1 n=1 Tax=Arabidopsis lyrata subsp. lyrata TaxID=81972 RepID=UPI000A29B9BA|nr:uncharacterized protein LOC9314605 isoform X1 [Arabidopsis lyrata subsp. lyrata]|eukprot:XP_020883929.1 uncharacterized protein LOC9314605 isoform X1 [Arabidopsis lyrata subsp. lyrata]